MRIWKCDKCGMVLEKDTDVFVVSCGEPRELDDKAACEAGIKSITCYKEYDLCCVCASDVEKFVKGKLKPGLYPSLKTIYDYCKSEECDNCLLNAKRYQNDVECMVGIPEDKWAKEYPDLEKESDPE